MVAFKFDLSVLTWLAGFERCLAGKGKARDVACGEAMLASATPPWRLAR